MTAGPAKSKQPGDAEKRLAGPPAPGQVACMTVEDVKALPLDQKIQLMEALWEDLRERFERLEVSPQHKDLLDRRRARVKQGAAKLLDWDAVKGTIGRP